jgi:hypothetical protein
MAVAHSNDHVGAAQVIREAFKLVHGRWPTEAERAVAQAVAHLETGYGRLGQFSGWPSRGLYNWGNVETRPNADGSCNSGWALGQDPGGPHGPNDNNVCFRVHPSDEEAAAGYLRVLSDPNYGSAGIRQRNAATLAALATGDPYAVASAMRNGGGPAAAYYTAPEAGYAAGVASRLKQIDAQVPRVEPSVFSRLSVPVGPIAAVAVVALVVFVAHRNGVIRLPLPPAFA